MFKNAFFMVMLVATTLVISSSVNAEVTVTQAGGDLYVVGDKGDDSVYVEQLWYSNYVYVYDNDTGVSGYYYGVDKVFVDTGNGDDYVSYYDFISADNLFYNNAAVCIDTGNGNDSINIYAFASKSLEVNTGNGDDYVFSYSYDGVSYGGSISINTENGEDECVVISLGDYIDVDLGNGKDTLTGYSSDYYDFSYGTLDGGNGKDSCSGFTNNNHPGTLKIVNCENWPQAICRLETFEPAIILAGLFFG
jgi:hypothetical protein